MNTAENQNRGKRPRIQQGNRYVPVRNTTKPRESQVETAAEQKTDSTLAIHKNLWK